MIQRTLAWAGVAALLALVALAWQNPALTVDLANLIRSCF